MECDLWVGSEPWWRGWWRFRTCPPWWEHNAPAQNPVLSQKTPCGSPPPRNVTKLFTGLLQPTPQEGTGSFVSGGPYGPEGEPPSPPLNVTKLFILDFNCQPLGRVPICFMSVAPKKSILARKLGKQGLSSTPATIGEYMSVGGCLFGLRARGWRMCIF